MTLQRTLFGDDEQVIVRGRWSEAEDKRLIELWGVWGIVEIAGEIQREPGPIRAHAVSLGLPTGMPSGYESFASVARRNRIHVKDVVRAKWAHNVPVAISLSWVPGENRVRYVDADLIDDAIKKWRREPKVRKHRKTEEGIAA